MKISLTLLTLLTVNTMASAIPLAEYEKVVTPLAEYQQEVSDLILKKELIITEELRASREARPSRASREVRLTRKMRFSRPIRQIEFVAQAKEDVSMVKISKLNIK